MTKFELHRLIYELKPCPLLFRGYVILSPSEENGIDGGVLKTGYLEQKLAEDCIKVVLRYSYRLFTKYSITTMK